MVDNDVRLSNNTLKYENEYFLDSYENIIKKTKISKKKHHYTCNNQSHSFISFAFHRLLCWTSFSMKEDIIKTLLDNILCHILSFLKTKYIIATSILSKMWKFLWLSVPILNRIKHQLLLYRILMVMLSRYSTLPFKIFHFDLRHDHSI